MIKVSMKDVGGETIKDNAQYVLKDNAFGNNLILSSTFLSCLLYTSPSPRDLSTSRMPSSA